MPKLIMTNDRPKFTPGPWRVPQCCTIHMDKPSWDEIYSPLVKSGREAVCGLSNVRVADAKLIAAAPEMYYMLCNILNDLETGEYISIADNTAFDIRGLLAMARGEETK